MADILSILDKCDVMRLGLCVDNKPYIVPMNFAYERIGEEVFIYFHSASRGRKLDMIAQNSNACFEADCLYRTVEADTPCAWSAEFESVLGEGTIAVLPDEAEKIRVLDLFMERYGFQGKPQYSAQALAATVILQLSVSSISGKCNMKK